MSEPMKPMEIEQHSFEIITELLGNRVLDPENELVIKRVIHTTADFDYADNLTFSDHAVQKGIAALKGGCDIVTDTQMAKAGINKTILASLGGETLHLLFQIVHLCRGDEAEVTTLERAVGHLRQKAACAHAEAFFDRPRKRRIAHRRAAVQDDTADAVFRRKVQKTVEHGQH